MRNNLITGYSKRQYVTSKISITISPPQYLVFTFAVAEYLMICICENISIIRVFAVSIKVEFFRIQHKTEQSVSYAWSPVEGERTRCLFAVPN